MHRAFVLGLSACLALSSAATAAPAPSRPDPAVAAAATPPPASPPPAAPALPRDYRKGLEALHAGKLDRAESAAQTMLNGPLQQAAGRQLLGLVKVKKGDLAGGLNEFDKALSNDPHFIPAREERAVTLARMGQVEKARADLDVLKTRAAGCAKACPPELRTAISRVEAALAAGRPGAALSATTAVPRIGAASAPRSAY